MNNLHIVLNNCLHASRVLKEAGSIVGGELVDRVFIAAVKDPASESISKVSERIEIKRFQLFSKRLPKIFFVQLLKYFEYCLRVAVYYRTHNIRVVNVHAIALLPFGVFLKVMYRAKLVYDAHELETETHYLRGFRKKLAKLIERTFIVSCDLIVVVSESIADWYDREYNNIARPLVVLNAPKYRAVVKSTRLRDELNIPSDVKIFLYQGGLMKGRGVELVLDTFSRLTDTSKVVVFMGNGVLESEICEVASRSKNIYYHRAVSPEMLHLYTSSADYGIHLVENTCLNHDYCMPNKIFEYVMAGLPVIVSNVKEMSGFVRKNDLGVVLEKQSVDGLLNAIEEIQKLDCELLRSGIAKTARLYCWENQETVLQASLRNILADKKQGAE